MVLLGVFIDYLVGSDDDADVEHDGEHVVGLKYFVERYSKRKYTEAKWKRCVCVCRGRKGRGAAFIIQERRASPNLNPLDLLTWSVTKDPYRRKTRGMTRGKKKDGFRVKGCLRAGVSSKLCARVQNYRNR